jgi:hypothetical protein
VLGPYLTPEQAELQLQDELLQVLAISDPQERWIAHQELLRKASDLTGRNAREACLANQQRILESRARRARNESANPADLHASTAVQDEKPSSQGV